MSGDMSDAMLRGLDTETLRSMAEQIRRELERREREERK
jgi:hypothetical protein